MNNTLLYIAIFGALIVGIAVGFVNLYYNDTTYITPNGLEKLIKENPKLVIIDVRTQNEYLLGHIKNAVNIDYYKGFKKIISSYLKCGTYVIYCETGFRSVQACKYMKKLGFKNIYDLKGGYVNWLEIQEE